MTFQTSVLQASLPVSEQFQLCVLTSGDAGFGLQCSVKPGAPAIGLCSIKKKIERDIRGRQCAEFLGIGGIKDLLAGRFEWPAKCLVSFRRVNQIGSDSDFRSAVHKSETALHVHSEQRLGSPSFSVSCMFIRKLHRYSTWVFKEICRHTSRVVHCPETPAASIANQNQNQKYFIDPRGKLQFLQQQPFRINNNNLQQERNFSICTPI